jgi:lactoylglutathione lyase
MPTVVAQYCINVSDLERSIRFYEDAIGLSVQMRIEGDGVTEVLLAGEPGGGQLQLARHQDNDGPIVHGNALWKIYFSVDDVHEMHRRVPEAGGTVEGSPQRLGRWPATIAFVRDPDGYLIELLQVHDD